MLVLAEPLLVLCCGAQLGFPLPALICPQALRLAGWSVSLLDLASVDHFDIIEKLSEETYVLTQVRGRLSPAATTFCCPEYSSELPGREGGQLQWVLSPSVRRCGARHHSQHSVPHPR